MEINNETLTAFRKDFKAAMMNLQSKYNVTIELGRITYYPQKFTGTLTVTNGRSKEDVERNSFDTAVYKYSHLGLTKGMYGRMFIGVDGETYALRGFQPRARKYPLIITNVSTGQKHLASEGFIRTLLNDYYTAVTVDSTEENNPLLLEGEVIDIEDV